MQQQQQMPPARSGLPPRPPMQSPPLHSQSQPMQLSLSQPMHRIASQVPAVLRQAVPNPLLVSPSQAPSQQTAAGMISSANTSMASLREQAGACRGSWRVQWVPSTLPTLAKPRTPIPDLAYHGCNRSHASTVEERAEAEGGHGRPTSVAQQSPRL